MKAWAGAAIIAIGVVVAISAAVSLFGLRRLSPGPSAGGEEPVKTAGGGMIDSRQDVSIMLERPDARSTKGGKMQVRLIPVTMFQSNCVVAWDEITGDGVLFDTGGDAGRIIDFVRSKGIQVKAIFLTHGHVDHVAGTNRVKKELAVPVYLHPEDRPLADATSRQCLMFGIPMEDAPEVDHDLAEGEKFAFGSLEFTALHLPGHSPGCTAFLFSGEKPVLVSGDVLFESSIGRTDLPGGDMDKMKESLNRLKQLADDVVVVPGHGRQTSIGREKKLNPYLSESFSMW